MDHHGEKLVLPKYDDELEEFIENELTKARENSNTWRSGSEVKTGQKKHSTEVSGVRKERDAQLTVDAGIKDLSLQLEANTYHQNWSTSGFTHNGSALCDNGPWSFMMLLTLSNAELHWATEVVGSPRIRRRRLVGH